LGREVFHQTRIWVVLKKVWEPLTRVTRNGGLSQNYRLTAPYLR